MAASRFAAWWGLLPSDRPLVRAIAGTALIGVPLAVASLLIAAAGPGPRDIVSYFLILLIAVLGLGIYSGNSGILSYGHSAFVGIGAYAMGILTLDVATKASALPNLPPWLSGISLEIGHALVITLVIAACVAGISGVAISRLPPYSASLATFGLYISVNAVLLGATSLTRGAQTFYGLAPVTDVRLFLGAAVAAVFVSRWFRESRWGLRLRATRDDPLAASAVGVDVARVRLYGWILSGTMTALSGALFGHWLTSFAPKDFGLTLTFTLVAMLIVGGATTTVGQVAGAALIAALSNAVRLFENGVSIGVVEIPPFYGLSQLVIGCAILIIIIRRREGLLGRLEIDEWLSTRRWTGSR